MKFSATGFTSTLSPCLLLALGALWGGMPKVQAASLTIGVIGDYGSAYLGGASLSNVQAVANLIKSWNPDFIITPP